MSSSRYYSLPSTLDLADQKQNSPPMSSPLRPMYLAQAHHKPENTPEIIDLQIMEKSDSNLKIIVRKLRLFSRIFSALISMGVFIPISLTLNSFLSTRNTYRDVPSGSSTINRNPWAKDTKLWPTMMYFAIALASLVLNLSIMIAYLRGVRTANKANVISLTFDWIVIAANLGVWIAAVVVYRNEKNKHGKSNDLWGWSCSEAASKIQEPFSGVLDFGRLCVVQSSSWYIGILHVVYVGLCVIVFVYVFKRKGSKKRLHKSATNRLLGQD